MRAAVNSLTYIQSRACIHPSPLSLGVCVCVCRLERNRESARQSRRRKKEYLDLLEQRVSALQQQIFELRTSHAAASTLQLQELKLKLLTSVEALAYKEIQSANGYIYTPEEEATLEDAASQ